MKEKENFIANNLKEAYKLYDNAIKTKLYAGKRKNSGSVSDYGNPLV